MNIFIYGESCTGKSTWIKKIGGIEKKNIKIDNIESFPNIYSNNEKLDNILMNKFNIIMKFNKDNTVILEKGYSIES